MTPPDFINISPKEFELIVYTYLKEIGSNLDKFEIFHNSIEASYDGVFQIDVKASFEALGTKITVLIECKNHKSPIKREVVQILKDKMQSLGAQKGIIFSSSKFQSGCIQYGEKHGIALVRLIEGKYTYETRSLNKDEQNIYYPPDLEKYVGQYIYDLSEAGFTRYNLSPGWTDGLLEFFQK